MPVYYQSSSPRKSNGFSIDDIIKNEDSSTISNRSSSYIPPITWYPSSTNNIYQFQRESMLQYLRHAAHQFTNPGAAVAAAFFLNSYRKPKRNRTAFTPSQLLRLENEFEKNHYIVGQERKDLAKNLNLPESKVKVWYQNRRTKHKRLINEDSHSSSNEIDHQNESETSDTIINIDDEQIWNNEDNSNNHIQLTSQQENSCSNS